MLRLSTRMSALGHEQTSRHVRVMTVIPLKADSHWRSLHVRFVPLADVKSLLIMAVLGRGDGAGDGAMSPARQSRRPARRFSHNCWWKPACVHRSAGPVSSQADRFGRKCRHPRNVSAALFSNRRRLDRQCSRALIEESGPRLPDRQRQASRDGNSYGQ
jgi:hypothetical protein